MILIEVFDFRKDIVWVLLRVDIEIEKEINMFKFCIY